jgi:hypothetical protein
MPRNPGKIIQLPDNRKVILYNDQPLIKQDKVLLYLIDEDFKKITDDEGKPKTIIKNLKDYNNEVMTYKLIGHID